MPPQRSLQPSRGDVVLDPPQLQKLLLLLVSKLLPDVVDTRSPKEGEVTIGLNLNIAHCVLLGIKYTMKKTCFPELPLLLMNPIHHSVTRAKNHVFLPRGIEGKAKKLFSAAPSLACASNKH